MVWTWTWAIDKCVKPVLFALFLFKYIGNRSSDFLHVAVRVRAQEPIKRRTLDSWFNELWTVFSIPLFTCTWNRLYLMFHRISFYSIDSLKEIIDLLDFIVFLLTRVAWFQAWSNPIRRFWLACQLVDPGMESFSAISSFWAVFCVCAVKKPNSNVFIY